MMSDDTAKWRRQDVLMSGDDPSLQDHQIFTIGCPKDSAPLDMVL